MKTRRVWALWLTAAIVAVPSMVFANVYPTNLSQSAGSLDKNLAQSVTLGFILNEDATAGVTVDILDAGSAVVKSFAFASMSKGAQSVIWDGTDGASNLVADGNYSFRVTAGATGHADWTQISVDDTLTNFYSPRGVTVNKDPSSPYYGRVYVVEPVGGLSAAGRTTTEGLYLLNSDLTDAVGQGDTGKKGGVVWGGTNSPFRAEVGPDGNVYVCDWSDTHSGLWMGDPDFNSASELLDSTGRAASGLNTTHGSIAGFMVEGVGAARKIYTMDEDLPNTGSLWRYDIGDSTFFTGPPSAVVFDDSIHGKVANFTNDVVRANDGTIWISQLRAGGTTDALMSLMQVSADGSTVLWASVPDLAQYSINDPLRATLGIAYDPVHDILALGTYSGGKILIFDPNTKSILATIVNGTGNSYNRDVAFDAVGNLYVVNNNNERLRVFSPGGANSSWTASLAPLGAIEVVPEPGSMLALGAGLAGFAGSLIRRRK